MIRTNTCNYERWCEIMIQEKLRRSEKDLLWHGIMHDSIVHWNIATTEKILSLIRNWH